jgi:hypothetical protein
MNMSWARKPVAFNLKDPEEAALYAYAKSLPNFSRTVKMWIKMMRENSTWQMWTFVHAPVEPLRKSTQNYTKQPPNK